MEDGRLGLPRDFSAPKGRYGCSALLAVAERPRGEASNQVRSRREVTSVTRKLLTETDPQRLLR
jgi:hypothetical protein